MISRLLLLYHDIYINNFYYFGSGLKFGLCQLGSVLIKAGFSAEFYQSLASKLTIDIIRYVFKLLQLLQLTSLQMQC